MDIVQMEGGYVAKNALEQKAKMRHQKKERFLSKVEKKKQVMRKVQRGFVR